MDSDSDEPSVTINFNSLKVKEVCDKIRTPGGIKFICKMENNEYNEIHALLLRDCPNIIREFYNQKQQFRQNQQEIYEKNLNSGKFPTFGPCTLITSTNNQDQDLRLNDKYEHIEEVVSEYDPSIQPRPASEKFGSQYVKGGLDSIQIAPPKKYQHLFISNKDSESNKNDCSEMLLIDDEQLNIKYVFDLIYKRHQWKRVLTNQQKNS